jgi:osmotically-inducible protein OsmY
MAANTQARSDECVSEDVVLELNWDPKIGSSDLAVSVKAGVVTLSGFVSSYWEKVEAEKAAKRVHGVRAVANDIEISLFWQRTDPEIARSVVSAFENNVGIPSDRITVTVKDGWVTLKGSVDWQYQKILAESAVKKLRRVTSIMNEIEVKPTVSAYEAKARIEEALRRSGEFGASRINVEVEGSTVKLYGVVQSWAERENAERVAWSASGITLVKNHITINRS